MVLHITNGDSVGGGLKAAGLDGDVLCWKDVLHDGPVPADLSLEELSAVRAGFLSGRGAGSLEAVRAEFARRDAMLRAAKAYSEVLLWFEHDLYDQLQLIQILDWFAGNGVGWSDVRLVQSHDYLGNMDGGALRAAYETGRRVTREQFFLARDAWAAFRAPAPVSLAVYLNRNPHLPCLGPALRRFAEEYPSTRDGLSRTGRAILEMASEGVEGRDGMFAAFSRREDPVFMGDWSFYWRLEQLQQGRQPLLDGALKLTRKGRAVLDGEVDRIAGEGIDLWLGGVHLTGEDSPWRWDSESARFVSRP